jgi:HEAT repeat protein
MPVARRSEAMPDQPSQDIHNEQPNQGAQGTFHGPVIFNQHGQPTPELLDHLADALRLYHQRLRERQANQRTPNIERPYKFLDFFELEDAGVFYGRTTEIEQVYQLQERSRLAVLHAPSGAGKTSLLQAGLLPRLLKDTCLPIYIRTGTHPLHTFYQQLLSLTDWASALTEKPFVEVLSALSVALPQAGLRRLVLIFDQFEELFVGTARAIRTPVAAAFKEVRAREIAVSLLISIRGDYLYRMGEFNAAIPSILNNQELLEAMSKERAEEAITRPLLAFYPPRHYAPDLLSVLLTDLSTGHETGVALPHLQIVCTELYRRLPADEHTITLAHYEQVGRAVGILGDYLKERLRWLGDQADLARAVLKELVSSEATRRQVSEASLQQRYADRADDLTEVMTVLVEQRILRRLEGENRIIAYEVAHEYLLEEVRHWLDEGDFEVKRAQEMLEREVASYEAYGMLIPKDKWEILTKHREKLRLGDVDTLACVILSDAYNNEEDFLPWSYSPGVVKAIIPALQRLNTFRAAAKALKAIGTTDAFAGLLQVSDTQIRREAAAALGKLSDPQAVPTLMYAFQHDADAEVRLQSAAALGKLSDPQAVPALMHALQHDADVKVRLQSALALDKSSNQQSFPALHYALQQDSDAEVLRTATEALFSLGDPQALPALANALLYETAIEMRLNIIETLRKQSDAQTLPALRYMLQHDDDVEVRRQVVLALLSLGDLQAIPILTYALYHDTDKEVRRTSVETLGKLGDSQATLALCHALQHDANKLVRRAAAKALERIGTPEALAAIEVWRGQK